MSAGIIRTLALRAKARTARQPTYMGGQGSSGYPEGAQGAGPGYQQGSQGSQESGNLQGTDPGDRRDPGTNYQ